MKHPQNTVYQYLLMVGIFKLAVIFWILAWFI
jgi:hypothetical protein